MLWVTIGLCEWSPIVGNITADPYPSPWLAPFEWSSVNVSG